MNQENLIKEYSKGTIVIHWLSTALILILFPLGKYMSGINPAEKIDLIKIHVILGLIVFVLTIIRTWLFFKAPRPNNLKTGSRSNDILVVWVHNAFYFLLFGIAVSGIATIILGGYGEALSSGNPELIIDRNEIIPLKAHGTLGLILMLLFAMHVAGVIKHFITKKENMLKRIS